MFKTTQQLLKRK
jgi:nitrite reductase/ring-hydroxylating ferredoxin subunit